MGLCSSSNYDASLPHTESWTSADSAMSETSEDADGNGNNLDDVGTYTEFEQTNLFGMKCDPERVQVLLEVLGRVQRLTVELDTLNKVDEFRVHHI